jgi:DNA ligase-1
MKRFAALFSALDRTTSTKAKTAALAAYFADAPEADRLWCIALLSGRRPRRMITTTKLREWAAERAGIPLWLFEGLLPGGGRSVGDDRAGPAGAHRDTDLALADWIVRLRALDTADEETRKAAILDAWDSSRPPSVSSSTSC